MRPEGIEKPAAPGANLAEGAGPAGTGSPAGSPEQEPRLGGMSPVKRPVKSWGEAWREGLAALKVVEIWSGRVERSELYAVEEELPSIEWRVYDIGTEGRYRAYLRLVLPPPREPPFDKQLAKANGVAAAFVNAFLSGEAKGGIRFADGTEYVFDAGDGFAVLESFVKLCVTLYGAYTTRGIKAEIDDVGGDYTDITVRATWRG
jgi:hypothetical protein